MDHIQNHAECTSILSRIFLLVDNHEMHVSVAAINYCQGNGIVLLSLTKILYPRMQPLCNRCTKRMVNSQKCELAFNDHMLSRPGKPITIYDSHTKKYHKCKKGELLRLQAFYPFHGQAWVLCRLMMAKIKSIIKLVKSAYNRTIVIRWNSGFCY